MIDCMLQEPSRRSEALKIPEQSQSKSLDPSKSTDQLTTLLVGEHDRPGMGKRHHIARVRREVVMCVAADVCKRHAW